MDVSLWVSLLCLQGFIYTGAFTSLDGGWDCTAGEVARLQESDGKIQELVRSRRDAYRSQIGAVSAKGFPNALLQTRDNSLEKTDRPRKYLSKKKRPSKVPKIGSLSLLKHNLKSPLQITRVRRDEEEEKDMKDRKLRLTARKNPRKRTGILSVLADEQIQTEGK